MLACSVALLRRKRLGGGSHRQGNRDALCLVNPSVQDQLYTPNSPIYHACPGEAHACDAVSGQQPAQSAQRSAQARPESLRRTDWANVALNIILGVAVIAIVVSLLSNTASGRPTVFAGYSASTILTGSMSDVYPVDTLVVTRQVDLSTLQLGDDITYMATEDSTVTHRIVEILGTLEGMDPSDGPAFRTKGTMNPSPDPSPVLGANVVGKVVFSSYVIGAAIAWLKQWWLILVYLLALAFGLKAVLKRINSDERNYDGTEGRKSKVCSGNDAPFGAPDYPGRRKGGVGVAARSACPTNPRLIYMAQSDNLAPKPHQ